MSPRIIFLDVGGVITKKEQQIAEFERLVGDCFASLLGGTAQAWTLAHRVVADRMADPKSIRVLAAADFVSFYRGINSICPA